MQNKANVKIIRHHLNPSIKRIYRNVCRQRYKKTNPKQTQFKANSNPIPENPKMNLTPYKKSNYVKYMTSGPKNNKPNSNPKRTQFPAASPRLHAGGSTQTTNRGQTQFKLEAHLSPAELAPKGGASAVAIISWFLRPEPRFLNPAALSAGP